MSEILQFSNRAEFRNWLMENHDSDQGVWLVFGKKGGPKTIKAGEALEEALCFGWIDGQMNQIDSEKYIKYFKRRQKKSRWSEKNKNIVRNLRTYDGIWRKGGRRGKTKWNVEFTQTSSNFPGSGGCIRKNTTAAPIGT